MNEIKLAHQWAQLELDNVDVSINRLPGSTSSLVYKVITKETEVILRQFNNKKWNLEEPDLVRHEAASLQKAFDSGLASPTLLAFDETGVQSGIPSILMSKMAGDVVLEPKDFQVWTEGLAKALTTIHKTGADDFTWTYFTYRSLQDLKKPTWSSISEKWEEAYSILRQAKPDYTNCFIHRDYHPANVLWLDGEVSGIVDWPNACSGPAGIDVGHCRLNLALLHSVEVADLFLEAYIRHAGPSFRYDLYWDILSAVDGAETQPAVYPGWEAFGVTGLTDEMMRERLDWYVESLLARRDMIN